MFIGHYALGLLARRKQQLPSLAMLFIAVQLLDLLWPWFVIAGIENFSIDPGNTAITPISFIHYPYSHSLLMALVWGGLLGIIYFWVTRNRNASLLLLLLVLSHWILDFITHRPDLPLTPFTETRVGLGLWNYPVAELVLEFSLFVAGAWSYWVHVKPRRKISYGLLIIGFAAIHLANVFGPPPPSVEVVAWSANLMWLFVAWAWWIEWPASKQERDKAGK